MDPTRKKRRRYDTNAVSNFTIGERFERLLAWAAPGGGGLVSDCVELCDDPQLGYHVRARRDLALGETVITMPASFMVNEATLVGSSIAAVLADDRSYVNHEVAVEAYHEELVKMSGEELLADILFHRKKAGRSLDTVDQTNASMPMTDRGLLMAFLLHARFDPHERATDGSALSSSATPNSWAPFAQSIPDEFNLPLLWAPTNLRLLSDCLLGHSILRSVAAMTRLVAHDFEKLRARLACATPRGAALRSLLGTSLGLPAEACVDSNGKGDSGDSTGTGIDEKVGSASFALEGGWGEAAFEKFLWASAAASSRSFGDVSAMAGNAVSDGVASDQSLLGGGRRSGLGAMVPVLDFLNHDPDGAQIEWVSGKDHSSSSSSSSSSSTGKSTDASSSDRFPRAVLRKKVRAGEQVLTHYGANRPNDELLICYGFAAWPSQNDQDVSKSQHDSASTPEDVLEIGWGLDDAPGGREVWLSSGSARVGAGNTKLDTFVEAMGRGGNATDASSSSKGSDGFAKSTEAGQRRKVLAMALARGERIEVSLTREAPLGELVGIARALTIAAGAAQMPALPLSEVTGEVNDNNKSTNELAAWAYLSTFLDAKLAKLMSHLQATLGKRFPDPTTTVHGSIGKSIESGNKDLKLANGSTTAAKVVSTVANEASAAPLAASDWWHAVVSGARGDGVGLGNVTVGKNVYAISAENCAIAAYHSKVSILQRAAALAASQMDDLRSKAK